MKMLYIIIPRLTVSCETQLNNEEECQNGMDDGDDSHSHGDVVVV